VHLVGFITKKLVYKGPFITNCYRALKSRPGQPTLSGNGVEMTVGIWEKVCHADPQQELCSNKL